MLTLKNYFDYYRIYRKKNGKYKIIEDPYEHFYDIDTPDNIRALDLSEQITEIKNRDNYNLLVFEETLEKTGYYVK